NFAAPWLGGPVLSGNQFSFFDNRGRAIGTGTGTWSVDGDTSLRFQSAEPRLNLRIDYQDDRVTGTFEPQGGAPPINIDVDQLLNRTPQWGLGTTWKLRAGVPVEPSQAARKVAENYAGIAWAGDTRLAYSSAGPIYR